MDVENKRHPVNTASFAKVIALDREEPAGLGKLNQFMLKSLNWASN